MLDAVKRKAQRLFAFACDRIVEADALDEPAVAAIARVGNDDIEKRTLLRAAAGKSDDDHGVFLVKPKKDFDYTTKLDNLATDSLFQWGMSLKGGPCFQRGMSLK
jgi:hypothetical protein